MTPHRNTEFENRISILRQELEQLRTKTAVELANTSTELDRLRSQKTEKDKQAAEIEARLAERNVAKRLSIQRVISFQSLSSGKGGSWSHLQTGKVMNPDRPMMRRRASLQEGLFNNHRLEKPPPSSSSDSVSDVGLGYSRHSHLIPLKILAESSNSFDFDTDTVVSESRTNSSDLLWPSTIDQGGYDKLENKKKRSSKFDGLFRNNKQGRETEALHYLNQVETQYNEIIENTRHEITTKENKILDWIHVVDHQSKQIENLRNQIGDLKVQQKAFSNFEHSSKLVRKSLSASALPYLNTHPKKRNVEVRSLKLKRSPTQIDDHMKRSFSNITANNNNNNTKNQTWGDYHSDPRNMSWQKLATYFNERMEASASSTSTSQSMTMEADTKSEIDKSLVVKASLQQQKNLLRENVISLEMKLRTLKIKLAEDAFQAHGKTNDLKQKLKNTRKLQETIKANQRNTADTINAQILATDKSLSHAKLKNDLSQKISIRCHNRLTKYIQDSEKSTDVNLENKLGNLRKSVEKASSAVKQETLIRKNEQININSVIIQEQRIRKTIASAMNSTHRLLKTAPCANEGLAPQGIGDKTKEKILVIKRNSFLNQQQIQKLILFSCSQLLLLVQQLGKDALLMEFEKVHKRPTCWGSLQDKMIKQTNGTGSHCTGKKALVQILMKQRDEQNEEIILLQTKLQDFTKHLKVNGEKKRELLKALSKQLQHSISDYKNKGIVINALQAHLKGKQRRRTVA